MDRRNWPWRRKSSEKTTYVTESLSASSATVIENQEEEDNLKDTVKYVQLTEERFNFLSGLEVQVNLLNEKLSTAQSELTVKENTVKQHTRVAEEAVSGWEKAEAEALALRNQLESVTLMKLTVEERAAHLDGALKECMKQVRNVKEEGEQKLHDIIFAKGKQWEKVQFELEEKLSTFEHELLRTSAENDALSRSLQERSNMLMKISGEKSQAEAEIEVLKSNIQSCEREISSMKYEVHIISKELEIRTEEKNMSVRSAEVANKQHLEDVKKITKLEAECQRLRTLVRKKLPGPAALAQMKLEVERDYGEPRMRRSPARNPSSHMGIGFSQAQDYTIENIQVYQKENEFLVARLMATEEETKMLKEALSKRNSELQASRNMFAKTASKLRSMEPQIQLPCHNRSPSKSNIDISIENRLELIDSKPPSMTSMSEDGIEDEGSCSESWATALMSELSHFKKEKDGDKSSKAGSSNHLELMDDFLEMEKLACLSSESNGPVKALECAAESLRITSNVTSDTGNDDKLHRDQPADAPSNSLQPLQDTKSSKSVDQLSKLQSKLSSLFKSNVNNPNMEQILDDIKGIVQDVQAGLSHPSECFDAEGAHAVDASVVEKPCGDGIRDAVNHVEISLQQHVAIESKSLIAENLKMAITEIHEFVLSFGNNLDAHKMEEFSSTVKGVLSCDVDIDNFVLILCSVISGAKDLPSALNGDRNNDGDNGNPDFIDKVTLLEKKVVQFEHGKGHSSQPLDDLEIVQNGQRPQCALKGELRNSCIDELEQLKQEKDKLATDLSKCSESLEQTRNQLSQTEHQLTTLRSQLTACEKSNSLTETQLKCMAESYRSLESRSQELESENDQLRKRAEILDIELQVERRIHHEDLIKLKEQLQEQTDRNGRCTICSQCSEADPEVKTKQEKEIAAAAEKLAECQETIFLLGRHLKALHPQSDPTGPSNERHAPATNFPEDMYDAVGIKSEPRRSSFQLENADMDYVHSTLHRNGGESPFDGIDTCADPCEPQVTLIPLSPFNQKSAKHRSSRSSSSPADEKHGRGFARFFSKGKSNH